MLFKILYAKIPSCDSIVIFRGAKYTASQSISDFPKYCSSDFWAVGGRIRGFTRAL